MKKRYQVLSSGIFLGYIVAKAVIDTLRKDPDTTEHESDLETVFPDGTDWAELWQDAVTDIRLTDSLDTASEKSRTRTELVNLVKDIGVKVSEYISRSMSYEEYKNAEALDSKIGEAVSSIHDNTVLMNADGNPYFSEFTKRIGYLGLAMLPIDWRFKRVKKVDPKYIQTVRYITTLFVEDDPQAMNVLTDLSDMAMEQVHNPKAIDVIYSRLKQIKKA